MIVLELAIIYQFGRLWLRLGLPVIDDRCHGLVHGALEGLVALEDL